LGRRNCFQTGGIIRKKAGFIATFEYCSQKGDDMKHTLHNLFALILFMVLSCIQTVLAADPAPIRATISRVSVSTHKVKDSTVSCSGNMITMQPRIKSPLLMLVYLHETLAGKRFYTVGLIPYGASSAPMIHKYDEIAELSRKQTEVASDKFKKIHVVNGKIIGPKWGERKSDKIIAIHCEFWQNGQLITSFDSVSPNKLKRLFLPEDWYIQGKYPNKFIYGR